MKRDKYMKTVSFNQQLSRLIIQVNEMGRMKKWQIYVQNFKVACELNLAQKLREILGFLEHKSQMHKVEQEHQSTVKPVTESEYCQLPE